MKFQVIEALKSACGGFIDPAMEAYYVQTEEVQEAENRAMAAIARGELENLDELCTESECAHERQGFINGFRLGVRLMGECGPLEGAAPEAATAAETPPAPPARGEVAGEWDPDFLCKVKGKAEDVQATFGTVFSVLEAMEDHISHYIKKTPFDKHITEYMSSQADQLWGLLSATRSLLWEMEAGQDGVVQLLCEQWRADRGQEG